MVLRLPPGPADGRAVLKPPKISRHFKLNFKSSEVGLGTLKAMVFSVPVYNLLEP